MRDVSSPKGADVNGVGDKGSVSASNMTPLWIAVNEAGRHISENWRIISHAVSRPGEDTDAQLADKRKRYVEIVQLLLASGADVNKAVHPVKLGGISTPLRLAVVRRDLAMVKLLLSKGADANAESLSVLSQQATKVGRKTVPGYFGTPLHEAVTKGSAEIVQALLEYGADPKRPDHEGKTAIDLARDRNRADLIKLLRGAKENRKKR